MLDFKYCKYYKDAEEKEHCAFPSICKNKCFFTMQDDSGLNAVELSNKVKDLEDDVEALQQELDCYTDSANEDRKHIECLYDVIINILKKQKGVKTYAGLENKYGKILSYLEDYQKDAVNYIITQVT